MVGDIFCQILSELLQHLFPSEKMKHGVAVSLKICVLNEKMQGPEKIRLLKEKYQLPVTDDFEKEVLVMTAYAAGLLKKGEIEGEINGEIKGEFKVNTLNDWLFSQDRVEDIRKATKDPEFQKTLFREMEESRKKDD
ncbi:MAG: hypothetical protein E7294_06985 [Lachnospiraceae bacterium]|nr:hypothetical protein [Lachnospiraceae bacterium]